MNLKDIKEITKKNIVTGCRLLILGIAAIILIPSETHGKFQVVSNFSIAEVYDDNIFQSNENQKKNNDFLTRIIPGLSASFFGSNVDLLLNYRNEFDFYNEFEEMNSKKNHWGLLNLNYRMSKNLTIRLNDSLVFTPREGNLSQDIFTTNMINSIDYLLNTSSVEEERLAMVLAYGSSDILTNSSNVELLYNVTPSFEISTGYSSTITEYGTPEFVDMVDHDVNFSMDYRVDNFLNLNLTSRYINTIFDTGEKSKIYSETVSISFQFSPKTSYYLSGGVNHIEGTSTDYILGVDVRKRLKTIDIFFTYNREMTNTRGFSGMSILESYILSFSQLYTERIHSEILLTYNKSNPVSGDNVSSDVGSIEINFNNNITKNTSLDFSYVYTNQNYRDEERGLIQLHQLGMSGFYKINKWLNIFSSYTYMYRGTSVINWPIKENRILMGINTTY